ncbi:RDD family protein [Desertivirga xinjiangensis]|uniref:RDD family protein n=1 Tax=Desertivirga xinjiangensis TaxID=539206 RepID=UPI00210D1B4D|nr:RDD family protein [Pedobacter xinjiangensis]
MQTVRITTAQNIDIDYEVAGLGPRILAYLLDFLAFFFIYILIFASGFGSGLAGAGLPSFFEVLLVVLLLCYAFYDLVCEVFFNGQSLGKKVMKIKVISLDGARPGLGQYLLRWMFRIIDFTVTMNMGGLLCVAATDKKQRIGDLVAGTTIVRTKSKTGLHHVAFMPPPPDHQLVFPEASKLSDSDVSLIYEVLNNFNKSKNHPLLQSTASRIREHLGLANVNLESDEQFLQVIVKDYNFLQIYGEEV